jgi:acyl-CoA synthetase (AMP-forming)/AMP-acid ligase II
MHEGATLNALLARASGFPEAGLRLLDRGERPLWLSWNEIAERARGVAGALAERGIVRGDRVALVFPTCADFFAAFFGALLAGAVPVPLYPPVRLGRLDEFIDRTAAMLTAVGARVVLSDARVRRLLGSVIEKARPPLGCQTPSQLGVGRYRPVSVAADDLGLVQFSSGTTVGPKPVALSHRALVAQTIRLNAFWPDSEGRQESGVSWLPLYHDMGLIGCIFPALERPAVVTLIPPEYFVSRPAVWLRAISRYGATISPAPNFAYSLCVEKIKDEELDGVDLSSWRVAMSGAEPVAPGVLRAFRDRFRRWGFRAEALTPVYGLSEAALAVTFSDIEGPFLSRRFNRDALADGGRAVADDGGIELVSVGRPLPDFELEIRDRDDRLLGPTRVGRVLVRGPSLMEGYLGRLRDTARVLRDGWLDTGDLGFILDQELYLTGRAKEVLILRGRNHAPEEVEHAVDQVVGVRTGCVVAASYLPEGADGEELVLLVEARPDGTPPQDLMAEIERAVRAATGLHPDRVELLDPGTLPRTSSGKLRRLEALRRWRAGTLGPPAPVTTLSVARAMARSSLALARVKIDGRKRN